MHCVTVPLIFAMLHWHIILFSYVLNCSSRCLMNLWVMSLQTLQFAKESWESLICPSELCYVRSEGKRIWRPQQNYSTCNLGQGWMVLVAQIGLTVEIILFIKFRDNNPSYYWPVNFSTWPAWSEHSGIQSSFSSICTRSHNVISSDPTSTERKFGPYLSFQQFY